MALIRRAGRSLSMLKRSSLFHGKQKKQRQQPIVSPSLPNLTPHLPSSLIRLQINTTYSAIPRGISSCSFRSSYIPNRLLTSEAQPKLPDEGIDDTQFLDFPGVKNTAFTCDLKFVSEKSEEVPCYRVLSELGEPVDGAKLPQMADALALRIYENMITLQVMDYLFYEAQRQGRFSFYMTCSGEEAAIVASAAALSNEDVIFAQYREQGALMWRGFDLQEFAHQCYSNSADYGKGRQMPIHYGSKKHNFVTISSPIATQLSHAVGAAYSLKMDRKDACAVTYFGDGATSEGDFHAAMNFAAVMEAPVLFICRNNGWAISTPITDQYRSDGVATKSRAYGMRSICVDGNDALAVYSAVKSARSMAISESRPILIEVLTYRVSHHSTSDDSTKYRSGEELSHWKVMRDPVVRFRRWLEGNGWWNRQKDTELQSHSRKKIIAAMMNAESMKKPPLSDLFTDVYDSIPTNLKEQESYVREAVAKNPNLYPSDVPL
ncbi:hypothetical protein O6H91_21G025300 [Diphasiastrum complanatum]|uniref:Uncharacterized protein n=2 Tax=Diphasiastrum complanatum TaxID=34168 RepID=A0ACC2AHY4_DIPCM|nr:hypothetical protein O6H91_21G009800 [Diphasiastrum complanatum]KAJ7517472.1 hypothetical protein O6H91_21G025300 [Diphasiastrum complanatum]